MYQWFLKRLIQFLLFKKFSSDTYHTRLYGIQTLLKCIDAEMENTQSHDFPSI